MLWRILVEKHEADKAGKDSWKVGHLQSKSCYKDHVSFCSVDRMPHPESAYRDVWVFEAKPIDRPEGRRKGGKRKEGGRKEGKKGERGRDGKGWKIGKGSREEERERGREL